MNKYDVVGNKYRIVYRITKGEIGNNKPIDFIEVESCRLIREKTDMRTAKRLHKILEKPLFSISIYEHPKGVKYVKQFRK